jgi:RNA polymerase sigma factor (sigma-70 family)
MARRCRSQLHAHDDDLRELVERALSGEPGAWFTITSRFESLIRATARNTGIFGTDVDDVSQETWFAVYRSLDTLREPECLAGWIRQIARNVCLSRLREVTPTPDDALDRADDVDVGGVVVSREAVAAVREAIGQLADRDRQLVDLMLKECPYDDIGEQLSMPVGSIGPTRQRVLQKMRKSRRLSKLAAG